MDPLRANLARLEKIQRAQAQPGLSRGKRRRLAHREKLASKQRLVNILTAQRKREDRVRRHGTLADMGGMDATLAGVLDGLVAGSNNNNNNNNGGGDPGASAGAPSSSNVNHPPRRGGGGGGGGSAPRPTSAQRLQPQKPNRGKVRNKLRSQIAAVEVEQFAAVTQHKAFQADPLAAIRAHLQNSIGDH